ncbi:ribosomal protein L19 [Polytolypa hystricis UAMH7299]|uniref:Ribosomal protein L19 n=1 Tax=Polytolypa hystricis (strain UAMH7299) TaxID=1447883 RepID=A0A2B7Z1B7_POLH7|nr:ribosomal protein L19 [Polytolypa hystricis UAMH7299]
MAAPLSGLQPAWCWRSIFRGLKVQQQQPLRSLHTIWSSPKQKTLFPENIPEQFQSQIPLAFRNGRNGPRQIKVFKAPPKPTCKEPLKSFTEDQLAILDPAGERKALFDRHNPQAAKVGDILRVTFKSGEPFAGVCINIRSRGVDTSFLLRGQLTRIACEMWVKVFSPNVQSVEIVQRTLKRKRRARLTYLRLPKHDMGSVEGVVRKYLRERASLMGHSNTKKR